MKRLQKIQNISISSSDNSKLRLPISNVHLVIRANLSTNYSIEALKKKLNNKGIVKKCFSKLVSIKNFNYTINKIINTFCSHIAKLLTYQNSILLTHPRDSIHLFLPFCCISGIP